jgi:hypothetical protein
MVRLSVGSEGEEGINDDFHCFCNGQNVGAIHKYGSSGRRGELREDMVSCVSNLSIAKPAQDHQVDRDLRAEVWVQEIPVPSLSSYENLGKCI